MTKLSPQEERLRAAFDKDGATLYGVDVRIDAMYEAVMEAPRGALSVRRAQMRLGTVISKVNKKVKGEKIIPGELKHTYRIVRDA